MQQAPVKFRKKKIKYCNNCNQDGHNYKECSDPITSYGIICYRIVNSEIEYLIIRRRFSFSYADFIRTLKPRRSNSDIEYLTVLLERMTPYEHQMLKTKTFDELWDNLWLINKYKHEKDHLKCKKIYNSLIDGKTSGNKTILTLKTILEKYHSKYDEAEWGFPKGKRNTREHDLDCAKREFTEESGINYKDIEIYTSLLPLHEEYKSINEKKYRSIYFLGQYNGPEIKLEINPENKEQYCEVDKIIWANLNTCLTKFRPYYTCKRELITNLDKSLREKYKL